MILRFDSGEPVLCIQPVTRIGAIASCFPTEGAEFRQKTHEIFHRSFMRKVL
jgi:hypothetical protein